MAVGRLSARDILVGNGVFVVIIPEPSTLGLALLCGLAMAAALSVRSKRHSQAF